MAEQKKSLARIIGLRYYIPEKVLSNQDLEKLVETSDEWIVTRTGMRERRIAADDEFPSDMGTRVAKEVLEQTGISVEDVDMILVSTMTPDYISPSTASLIQANIKAINAAVMDIQAACTGFLYALSIAKAYIESNMYKTILVVTTEKMSAFLDYTDRSTCILFGDGASAAVVTGKGKGLQIDTIALGADGNLSNLIIIPGGGARHPATEETVQKRLHYIKMIGNEVFKHAVRRMSHAIRDSLEKKGLKEGDINWLIPHQANVRIIDAISKNFDIPDSKVHKTVHKYGNTSSSSIGIGLGELMTEHTFKAGEHIVLTAFGGGLTWGASILTMVED